MNRPAPRSIDLVAELRTAVAAELHADSLGELGFDDRRELARELTMSRLRRRDSDLVTAGRPPLDPVIEQQVTQSVLDALFGLGRLQTLVDDERIENIDVNGCDQVWVTYADGSKALMEPVADSDDELIELLRSARPGSGCPSDGSTLLIPSSTCGFPTAAGCRRSWRWWRDRLVSIRRHRYVDLTLDDLIDARDPRRRDSPRSSAAVSARGRTSWWRGDELGQDDPGPCPGRRDTAPGAGRHDRAGLRARSGLACADRHPDLVALEAREANTEGEGAITMARLVRRALRMNADRVIVGEVLGDEVLPMLNAMSQGRSGSMCTIHADSSAGVFRRLASYAVQAPERLPLEATTLLVAGAVHFVVFLDVETPARRDLGDDWVPGNADSLHDDSVLVVPPCATRKVCLVDPRGC